MIYARRRAARAAPAPAGAPLAREAFCDIAVFAIIFLARHLSTQRSKGAWPATLGDGRRPVRHDAGAEFRRPRQQHVLASSF